MALYRAFLILARQWPPAHLDTCVPIGSVWRTTARHLCGWSSQITPSHRQVADHLLTHMCMALYQFAPDRGQAARNSVRAHKANII
eukprot:1160621-Pelagomonas_calceolata.AAC.6